MTMITNSSSVPDLCKLFNCNSGIIYYENEQAQFKWEYKNGKLNGEYTSYYKSGKIKDKWKYKGIL
jgi:hypothetical protein